MAAGGFGYTPNTNIDIGYVPNPREGSGR